jgi:hypothetical protein
MSVGGYMFQTSSSEDYDAETFDLELYLTNHTIPENFKDLTILHRDILLESMKATIIDGEIALPKASLMDYYEQSKATLTAAVSQFAEDIPKNRKIAATQLKQTKRKLRTHHNPWELYEKQFDELSKQILQISQLEQITKPLREQFNGLKKTSNDLIQVNKELNIFLDETLSIISQETDNLADFVQTINEQLSKQSVLGNDEILYTELLTSQINQLEPLSIPVGTQDGMLTMRDIDLNKTVQKWFDYEILPAFSELILLEKAIKNRYQVDLGNISNTVKLNISQEGLEVAKLISKSKQKLATDLERYKVASQALIQQIHHKSEHNFQVSNLFKNEPFLEIAMNTSILVGKKNALQDFREKINNGISKITTFYRKAKLEDPSTPLEISTRCISHRMYKEENEHYDSLFLNKRFIGDLFLVARKHQEEGVKNSIALWNDGFKRATLVTGTRLSGRTTFMDYVSKKYFENEIVLLKPDHHATIDGRKFTTTYDLCEALEYVKRNNAKNTRPVVIIDDLELWRNKEHSLLQNVRALINFIETSTDNAYLMVSTTARMQARLNSRLEFTQFFTTVVDTSKTASEEIVQAVMVRHGASQKELISEKGLVLNASQMAKIAREIGKDYKNNIGEVLQAWTYRSFIKDDDKVLFVEGEVEFVDFLNAQECLILKQTLLFKYITELGLKRIFSDGFDARFKSALRRLINTKILLRSPKGELFINPVVLMDINEILKKRKI